MTRGSIAGETAADLGAVVVCKGAPTATGLPSGETVLNSTGNPGMASAGMGDVLTGVIAGLWAQGMSADDAAVAGVFIHGLAADLAVQRVGMQGLMAQDVIELTGVAIARVGGA
jgi:NAD(P)H-hydrate repair Nnr-like enzyme with NAD(P)H-hydrate dehydratase domain